MKKLFFFAVACCISLLTMAQPPKGQAKQGMIFGEKTSVEGAMTTDELSEQAMDEEMPVKVKGTVTDVCTAEGCWLKMKTSNGKMMVKMKDHAFLVPVDINGKEIVVEGTAKTKVTSVKEQQHYAEDAGKSKEEIAAIKEPKKEVVIQAKGILVL